MSEIAVHSTRTKMRMEEYIPMQKLKKEKKQGNRIVQNNISIHNLMKFLTKLLSELEYNLAKKIYRWIMLNPLFCMEIKFLQKLTYFIGSDNHAKN